VSDERCRGQTLRELGRTSFKGGQVDAARIPSNENKFCFTNQANETRTAILNAQNDHATGKRTAILNAQNNHATEKRTAILNAQINHAKLLASARDTINSSKSGHIHRLSQKHAAELQHVKFAVSPDPNLTNWPVKADLLHFM
jgi:hypothetical protein